MAMCSWAKVVFALMVPWGLAQEIGAAVEAAAHDSGVRPSLLLAVAMHESGLDPKAVSKTGDWGLWQLNPRTMWYRVARGTCEAHPPACVMVQGQAAAALLRANKRYCRTWGGALQAYNSGRCAGAPDYARRVFVMEKRVRRIANGA